MEIFDLLSKGFEKKRFLNEVGPHIIYTYLDQECNKSPVSDLRNFSLTNQTFPSNFLSGREHQNILLGTF